MHSKFYRKFLMSPNATNKFFFGVLLAPFTSVYDDVKMDFKNGFNSLALELDIYSLAHHLCKM